MRKGFQQGILEAAKQNPLIHILSGDHGYDLFDQFRMEFPTRFHNVGVSEADMVGIASGFARNGLKPIIYGLAAFVPSRVFEFIKLQIALDGLPVVIVGDGAGIVYSYLGKSHQTLEDLALMGSLPQVTSLSPGSDKEMKTATLWAVKQGSPVYLRIGKSDGHFQGGSESDIPEPVRVHESPRQAQSAIIAHGSMVSQALLALNLMEDGGVDIWSCPTIFPIPEAFLDNLRRSYSKVFVVEEHGTRGGLASEFLIRLNQIGIEVTSICAQPTQSSSVGSYIWNIEQHGLSASQIAEVIKSKSTP